MHWWVFPLKYFYTGLAVLYSDDTQGVTCVEIDDDDDCTFSYVLNEGSEKVEIFAEEEKSKTSCFGPAVNMLL